MNKIITIILILVSGGISTLAQVPTKTFRERKAFETPAGARLNRVP